MNAPTEAPLSRSDRAAKRGAQVALLIFLVLSIAFALSSTWQLAHAVFFEDAPKAPSAR